jgi:hypothetical protein
MTLGLWMPPIVALALLVPGPRPARAQGAGADSVRVSWTAPGDDGNVGTATLYELRISTAPITPANWSSVPVVPGLPLPRPSGTHQQTTVRGLSSDTTYYFAIRTEDDAGNWSGLSNVVRWDWTPATAPPAPPTGLTAVRDDPNVRLSWSPNHESDLAGYSVYRATAAGGPYAKLNAALVLTTGFLDSSVPSGVAAVWYQVTATNTGGSESAPATVRVDLSPAKPLATWTVLPGYPNPSPSSQPVCIPVTTPTTAAGDAALDILDAGGRRVRHLALAGAAACAAGGVLWDGRNDAGFSVAPGVYSVRLTVDGEPRSQTRLVRQP